MTNKHNDGRKMLMMEMAVVARNGRRAWRGMLWRVVSMFAAALMLARHGGACQASVTGDMVNSRVACISGRDIRVWRNVLR